MIAGYDKNGELFRMVRGFGRNIMFQRWTGVSWKTTEKYIGFAMTWEKVEKKFRKKFSCDKKV